MAVASLIGAQTVACSTPTNHSVSPATSGSSAQQSTSSQAVKPDDVNGPVIAHCPTHSTTTTLSKLNVDTGQLTDIATFPISCYGLSGQYGRLQFSRDFRKAALEATNDNHARYYDSTSRNTIDVTNIVSPPPTGDFGNRQNANDTNAQFDDQGLFVYYDNNAQEYKFFDTASKKVVNTSRSYLPKYVQGVLKHPETIRPGGPNGDDYTLCSPWFWVMDGGQYLRSESDNNSNHFLVIDSVPARSETVNCSDTTGQRITPPTTEISEAAADPTGSTILFMVFSRTDIKVFNLYRANLNDPSHPTQIKMSGEILEHAGYDGGQIVGILGWK
jgi:hypothetical protein